jgi:hypothetical protein
MRAAILILVVVYSAHALEIKKNCPKILELAQKLQKEALPLKTIDWGTLPPAIGKGVSTLVLEFLKDFEKFSKKDCDIFEKLMFEMYLAAELYDVEALKPIWEAVPAKTREPLHKFVKSVYEEYKKV